MATIFPNAAMHDLKVTYQKNMFVFPSQQTEKKSLYLSNIDQILNYNIPTANFFSANPKFPPQLVIKRLKIALEKVLVTFDFMAGRLKFNNESGRLEIECNAAGAGFVVASSDFSLDEIGDLGCPNLGFKHLAVQELNNLGPNETQPLCVFQLTSFKCGGFCFGMSVNHILLDGISAKTFKENLASQAFGDNRPLAFTPYLNRRLMASRSPPIISYPHPEFSKPKIPISPNGGPPVFDCIKEDLDYIIFKLTPTHINFLKDKAKNDINANTNKKMSSFNVVASLMWRCKALSHDDEDMDRVSAFLNVVDLRSRLNPPLPPFYCGNGVLCAYASSKCLDIQKGPFSNLVEMVMEGSTVVTDEYARSAIDWLEVNKGVPHGEYMVSSWLRLGFDEVVYPWGKPMYSCPVVSHRKDICWVFPADNHGAINALVSLPATEMEKFRDQFNNFFA